MIVPRRCLGISRSAPPSGWMKQAVAGHNASGPTAWLCPICRGAPLWYHSGTKPSEDRFTQWQDRNTPKPIKAYRHKTKLFDRSTRIGAEPPSALRTSSSPVAPADKRSRSSSSPSHASTTDARPTHAPDDERQPETPPSAQHRGIKSACTAPANDRTTPRTITSLPCLLTNPSIPIIPHPPVDLTCTTQSKNVKRKSVNTREIINLGRAVLHHHVSSSALAGQPTEPHCKRRPTYTARSLHL